MKKYQRLSSPLLHHDRNVDLTIHMLKKEESPDMVASRYRIKAQRALVIARSLGAELAAQIWDVPFDAAYRNRSLYEHPELLEHLIAYRYQHIGASY